MKAELLRLLKQNPASAGHSDDKLDGLAEDLQAVIIRALVTPTDPAIVDLEARVDSVFNDVFGATLFNLFTTAPFEGKRALYFSSRKAVVQAMIQTMFLEQDNYPSRVDDVVVAVPASVN